MASRCPRARQFARSGHRPCRWAIEPLALDDEEGVAAGGVRVERLVPAREVVGQHRLDGLGQPASAPAPRSGGRAVAQLCGRDRRGRDRARGQGVEPRQHGRLGGTAHQLQDHVGIEDDHGSRATARGWSVDRGNSTSSASGAAKRACTRLPLRRRRSRRRPAASPCRARRSPCARRSSTSRWPRWPSGSPRR